MACAVYARQSVEKKDSLSIDGQIELCRRAAGGPLEVYSDRGYSGKNTARPGFQRLMADVRSGLVEKLYVYRLDRFSRSVADFGRLWETLQLHRVEFVSVSESFDTSTPMGRAMLHIIMVFAQLERETTAERVRDNYYRRACLGHWPGGPAPYGYTTGRMTDSEGRSRPALVPIPEQADAVRRIFTEYAREGATLGTLAKGLNAEGVPAPRRGSWDSVAISRLLRSPVYLMADRDIYLHYLTTGVRIASPPEDFDGIHGLLLVGRRDRSKSSEHEQTLSVLNSDGLVPSGLWLTCQRKLARNRQIKNTGSGTHTWLSGLLKCARCGYSLKVTKDRYKRYVHCSGRYNQAKCTVQHRVDLDGLERAAAEQIQQLWDACPSETPQPRDSEVQAQLRELDRREDMLLDAYAQGTMPQEALKRTLDRLERQREAVLEAEKRAGSRRGEQEPFSFDRLSFEEKKAVAAQFIRRIEADGSRVTIYWNV